ncbi:DUF192 domain-containing protein [Roseibium aggregatum]|uniref:DUF192 domain-containing protein n=1 Tax=Roseibium aggregatum TaxID=187304 RepID=UPI001E3B7053|nr:DUF192 domain-containing protein [Roseibium aggregatum]UES57643.1 DUF192 domain-containing protein [Roseibium aggregatum]
MRPFFLCLSLFAATLWISLAGSPGQALAQDPQLNLPVEDLLIRSGDKEHQFKAEVAATDRQRSMGLMFRKEMPAERGMLFLFEGEGDRYFWMKNTPLPLDIIFIDAKGSIVSIADNTTPFSEDVIPSLGPAKYVFEINAGLAEKLDISAGDKVSSPSMGLE